MTTEELSSRDTWTIYVVVPDATCYVSELRTTIIFDPPQKATTVKYSDENNIARLTKAIGNISGKHDDQAHKPKQSLHQDRLTSVQIQSSVHRSVHRSVHLRPASSLTNS